MDILMSRALSFCQKYAKVCLLCLAFISVPLWLNANHKQHKLLLHEFVSLIPLWEVPPNSPPNIIGDEGRGYGYYQIHQIMVEDFNRITGQNLAHEDVFDARVAWTVAYKVLEHYSKHIHSLGHEIKVEHWLYIWNGGGNAWKRVNNPQDDQKQENLIRYKNRAIPIIINYINGKEKRSKPSERTQV